MNRIKFICILLVIFFHNSLAFAQEEITSLEVMKAKSEATDVSVKNLESFGFGPALYFIQYKDEVLKDPKDVRVRGDGSIVSNGSKFSVNFGLEVHYDFAFFSDAKCIPGLSCDNYKNYSLKSSHIISPFLGVFDIENGINGIAAGVIYGYTKEKKEKHKLVFNVGVGWMVHKGQQVLSSDVIEGTVPPANLQVEDYTERKDVEGITIMISSNFGF
jgi:hypothetical protein